MNLQESRKKQYYTTFKDKKGTDVYSTVPTRPNLVTLAHNATFLAFLLLNLMTRYFSTKYNT